MALYFKITQSKTNNNTKKNKRQMPESLAQILIKSK